MDSFLSLFDPGVSDELVVNNRRREENGNVLKSCSSNNILNLPPEPELGNIEYKLKLINPSENRLQHLATQMNWRLREGQGEAIYQIGVEDSGRMKGLCKIELDQSIETVKQIAVKLGATTTILRKTAVSNSENAPKFVAEVLVRKVPDDQPSIDLIVAVMGNADAGKSTLLGVLTQGEMDDGRGKARLNMLKHLHEIQSGRTSSIGHEFLGFDSQGRVINYQEGTPKTICDLSTKLVTLIDLAGHQKYLRTTIRGLTGYSPHYILFVISSGGNGFTKVVKDHLTLALALQIPVVIAVTKIDLTTEMKLEKTLHDIETYFRNIETKKRPFRVNSDDDVITVVGMDNIYIPIICISSVTGEGLSLLYRLLFLLPPGINAKQRARLEALPPEFQIDETFRIPRQGKVHVILGGLLTQGIIKEGTKMLLGPFNDGGFRAVTIVSIRRHKATCRTIRAHQSASIGLDVEDDDLRTGMVLISPNMAPPKACIYFQATVCVLYHATAITKKFQTTVYIGSVRQTCVIEDISSVSRIATDDEALVTFRFIKNPEYVKVGSRLLFREGATKGFGTVTRVYELKQ